MDMRLEKEEKKEMEVEIISLYLRGRRDLVEGEVLRIDWKGTVCATVKIQVYGILFLYSVGILNLPTIWVVFFFPES